MSEDVRLAKNERIRIKGKATRERHKTMRPIVVSLKLSLGCLNNKERSKFSLTSSNVVGSVITS